MQKKYKILALVLIAAFAVSAFAAAPSIASWIDNSIVNITASTATSSFTTQVVGIYTNATTSPLDINGAYYASVSGGGVSAITSYNSGPIAGDPSHPSTVALSVSGFVPNDLVEFQVTITNTGSTTLAFQTYSNWCLFVNPNGSPYTYPNSYSSHPTTPVPVYNPWTFLGFNGGNGGGLSDTQTFTSATDSTNRQVFADGLIDALAGGNNVNWEVGWGNVGTSVPATLAPSATFVYNIYVGLGTNVPYGIPAMFFSITIPMMVAN